MRRCDRTDWHVSHQWGIEYADMGTIWEDCPGLSSWETDGWSQEDWRQATLHEQETNRMGVHDAGA